MGRMGEGDLRGLRGHGVGDGVNAVTNADDGSLTGSIEILLTVGSDDPGTFTADGSRKRFFEVAREESGGVCSHDERNCSRGHTRISLV